LNACLALVAGAIHLAHNYLPMSGPPAGAEAGVPPPAAMNGAGPSGLMGLVGPHMTDAMILNFVAFVGLAVVMLAFARTRPSLRVVVNLALACMSVVTLYAWNAMGRANPENTGTLALLVESVLIVLALADAVYVTLCSRTARVALRA
jgi:hypothetical protein